MRKQNITITKLQEGAYSSFIFGIFLILLSICDLVLALSNVLNDFPMYAFGVFFSGIILICMGIYYMIIATTKVEKYQVEACKIK